MVAQIAGQGGKAVALKGDVAGSLVLAERSAERKQRIGSHALVDTIEEPRCRPDVAQ